MTALVFEIYIDQNFVQSIDEKQFAFNDDPDLQDFFRFITKLKGEEIRIITNASLSVISPPEKMDDHNNVSPFWLKLYEGDKPPEINEDFCEQLDNKFFYNKSSGFKLFFVERSDVDDLSKKFGFLYINSSTLPEVWRLFSDEREDLSLPITDNPICTPRFDSWQYLKKFSHPFNSVILCDRYILQNKGTFRSNLFALFQALNCHNLTSIDLEVVIISELIQVRNKVVCHNDIDEYSGLIETQLSQWMKIKNLTITVVKLTHDEAFYREHGRALVTNYWYINPQNSFNFFRYDAASGKSKLVLSDNIDFRFVFRKPVRNLLKERLRVMNEIFLNTKNTATLKKVYTNGAKKSRLLPA